MQFKFDHDVDSVFKLFTDPAIYIERCEALGETKIQCDTTTTGSRTNMKVSRTVERELPGPLAKIASGDNTIKSDVVWNDEGPGKRKTGSYNAVVDGSPIPITIKSEFSLEPTANGGTTYNVTVDVKAKHLLLGKVAEGFASKQVEAALPQEYEWNVKKLASMA